VPVVEVRAADLLAAAARLYDERPQLAVLARSVCCSGFAGGAQWMRAAMAEVRGLPQPESGRGFTQLGLQKYLLATAAALTVVGVACWSRQYWLLPLAVVAFYLVEVRFVFAFPLALDGDTAPLRSSNALVARYHGAPAATWTVMQLAAVMLFGGLCGRGWLRCWCLGCLGVVLWYERLGARSGTA
jgi:hypothetical protein